MKNAVDVEVEGVDGSIWHLYGHREGEEGVHLGMEPDGLVDSPVRTLWTQTASGRGATAAGVRWEPRDLVFTALVGDRFGRDWQTVDSAWRRAWSYEDETIIRVTTTWSGTRELRCQLFEAPQVGVEMDPNVNGFAQVVMTVRAANPFWRSLPEYQTVEASSGSPGSVVIDNPTDTPGFSKWVTIAGARWTIPDFDFKGSQRVITLPASYTDSNVVIDTDPLEETITVAGWPNAWDQMGGVDFLHPVPPGTPPTEVPVSWTGSSGSLTLVLEREWTRPWGLE